jgi:hypothetical protein
MDLHRVQSPVWNSIGISRENVWIYISSGHGLIAEFAEEEENQALHVGPLPVSRDMKANFDEKYLY